MEIEVGLPAERALLDAIHDRLAEAGQSLTDAEMPRFTLAAHRDGRLVAGGTGEIAFRSLHLSELWVDESLRGQGMGSRLIERAEALAAERGCDRVHLETRSEAARRLYERLGYRVFGQLDGYAPDGTPLYYLEKRVRR